MDKKIRHDFRIDVWRPETLPMARLAEYLAELAVIYGEQQHVHFIKMRKGSVIAETLIDIEAIPTVSARLRSVESVDASAEIIKSFRQINKLLREDNATAVLREKKGAEILHFPGKKLPIPEEITVPEQGTLDGTVIRVGGKDDTVPVWLQSAEGDIYKCTTNRLSARELAFHIFGQVIRVSGCGKWRRTVDRGWELDNFQIQTWEPLDETSLKDVLNDLRAVEGSGWNMMDDPQEELRKMRGD